MMHKSQKRWPSPAYPCTALHRCYCPSPFPLVPKTHTLLICVHPIPRCSVCCQLPCHPYNSPHHLITRMQAPCSSHHCTISGSQRFLTKTIPDRATASVTPTCPIQAVAQAGPSQGQAVSNGFGSAWDLRKPKPGLSGQAGLEQHYPRLIVLYFLLSRMCISSSLVGSVLPK